MRREQREEWEGNGEQIDQVNLSEYTGEFIIEKTQIDIQEMNKLQAIRLLHPDQSTKFYREKMEYSNRQLKTIQGYLDELDGKGRNSYFV